MAGFLESLMNPAAMGLLNLGTGLLDASGPSPYPVSTGQALSRGLQSGIQGAVTAQQLKTQSELKQAQLAELQRKTQAEEEQRALRNAILARYGVAPLGAANAGPAASTAVPPALLIQGAAGPTAAPQAPALLQAPQGNPQGNQTPMGGIDQNAALLMLSGDPGLMKLGGAIQEANKPVAVTEGGALVDRSGRVIVARPKLGENVLPVYDQAGNIVGVRPMPGAAEAAGLVTGAEERAKAQYDLVPVPDGRGGTVMLPRAQAAQLLGGGQPMPPQLPRPTSVGPTQREARPAGGLGYTPPAAQTAAATRFAETAAGEFAKNYADLQRADFNAPATMAKYQRLGNLLSQVNTGKFTATTTQIKAAAKSAGIDLGALGVSDDVAPAQAALSLSNQLALELRNPAGGAGMPGALSDKDREFLVAMIPGLENDPGAIPLMIEYRMKLAQREQQVAKMARAYKKRTGKFDDGFYDELAQWSASHPLFSEADKAKAGGGSGFKLIGVERQ